MEPSLSSQEFSFQEPEMLESKDLPSVQRLGRGLSGFVYETRWKGNRYARKDFPVGAHDDNFFFQKEARPLLNINHPNILKCYRYTVGKSSCSLVQEFVDDNFQDAIRRRIEARIKAAPPSSIEASSSKMLRSRRVVPFEVSEAVDITSQIATGMQYLHEQGVVHGDLKPKNVLVYLESDTCESGKMIVKVGDFGFVKTKSQIKLVAKRARQNEVLMWKAPELFDEFHINSSDSDTSDEDEDEVQEEVEGKRTHETSVTFLKSRLAMADVYSFGLTCSYILGGRLWNPDLSFSELREQRREGFRPDLPSFSCPEYLKFIIGICLEVNPSRRPTFSTICSMIDFFRMSPELFIVMKDTIKRDMMKGYGIEDIISSITTLRLKDCYEDSTGELYKLTCLPRGIGKLTALETLALECLDVVDCSSLEELLEEIGNLTSLTKLKLKGCSKLKTLPHGIGNLTALESLDVLGCSSLEELPEEIGNLTSLTKLKLKGCPKLKTLPHGIGKLTALVTLEVSGYSSLRQLPEKIASLLSLTTLDLLACSKLRGLPHGIDEQSNTVPMFDAQHYVSELPSIGALAVLNNHEQRLSGTHQTDNQRSCELTLDSKALNGVAVGHNECPSIAEVPMDKNQQVSKRPGAALPEPSKVIKKRKWTEDETRILLLCKDERGRFFRDDQTGMNWDSVSREISNTLRTTPSAEQCRRRYETLQKAYKSMKDYCAKTSWTFSEITEDEKVGLKLATTLTEEWYKRIDAFSHKVKPQTRPRLSGVEGTRQVSPGDVNHSAPVGSAVPAPAAMTAPGLASVPVPTGNSSRNQIAIPNFKSLQEDLRSTLLDLMMFLRIGVWELCDFEDTCRRVGIVQNRKPCDIRNHVMKLSALKLVNFKYYGEVLGRNLDVMGLNVEDLGVYEKFVKEVLRKNPDLDICLNRLQNHDIVSIPEAPVSLSVRRIRVLTLFDCGSLQCVDLSFFPQLLYLHIFACCELVEVTGWEAVKELGYIEIQNCDSYNDFPQVQRLPSLMEFQVDGCEIEISSVPDFSQCSRLGRLKIRHNKSSALNSMDLSTLRFLEVLDLSYCDAFTAIQGLSRLHSLTKLDLYGCKALSRVPELGCLKALTKLNMNLSGVEEISGVQELHLLTSLSLHGCHSLKTLPCLGHLKALSWLDISGSGVEEIPGVQDLISLEKLSCAASKLKSLPPLHHLTRLQTVGISDTPLSTTESPSSIYYGEKYVDYESLRERKDFDDDISDISDTDSIDISH